MPQVRIIAKNFIDMVASLPAVKLDMLYANPFICEAILRSLPPLAKKYVLQMLYIDAPVPAKSMEEWVLPDGLSKHRVAIDRLIQLRVLTETVDRKKETSYEMNQKFQLNLQKQLIYGGVLPRESMPSNSVMLPSLEELEMYALEQWEVCTFPAASYQLQPSGKVNKLQFFNDEGFPTWPLESKVFHFIIEKEGSRLTEYGFQFLLMDTNAQLWYIVREYIANAEERGVDPASIISFLLELSFHEIGQAYNLNTLNEVQQSTIKDLADLGLVKLQQGRKESWFLPTKLATTLSVCLSDTSTRRQGYVVVETNFRLYAYTTSKLHCEIMRLFARVEYQLPNLIVGAINKESLYNAFENGITADQARFFFFFFFIILFLQQNAHPRVAEKTPTVPENVTDQIRLWESDLNRIEMSPAQLYDEFPSKVNSKDLFEAACDYAREYGALLWEDSKKMQLVVKSELHNEMREYLRRQK
ncbi:General transcription and DNA repair factor IIH subunit TFB2 [Bienertia sinuspersici]